MCGVLVSVDSICAGEHVVCIASTQDEKCTETEAQKGPEKKMACNQIVGYPRICLGGQSGKEVCFCQTLELKD